MPVVMTVLLLALIASAIPAAAADRVFADNPPVRFYWRKAEGWFWYEPIPEPTKPERPLPEQPARSPTARQTTAPTVFSAAWFRQNLPKYKDLAWDHPTLTNLRAFLWVQRLTLDRQAGTAQARLLNELAQRVGLLFFFHSTCPACATQAPLVRMLAKQHRFSLIPVSIDGQDLPGHPFPAFKPDRGQAAKLQVQAVPALYLTAPNGQFAAVGQGAMSLPEIQRRLLVVAK